MTDFKRWERAQKAERNHWLSIKESWAVENSRRYWQEKLAHGFGLSYEFFNGYSVLEVGCGPQGIIYGLDNVKSKIGLEPMDLDDLVQEDSNKTLVKKGVGEKMPFENNSFDVILCFNSLDHCLNPGAVIGEIYRVLRREGHFLLWIYVLRNQYYLLRNFLDRLDEPHPHHLTRNEIFRLLKDNSFSTRRSKLDNGTGLHNKRIKNIIGNFLMNSLWLWLVKK